MQPRTFPDIPWVLRRLLLPLSIVGAFTCVGRAAQRADLPAEGAYKRDRGPFQVLLIRDLPLKDAKRNTQLLLHVRAPRSAPPAGQRFPLVIFSHGAGGSGEAFAELCEHWAAYGYVVVNPTHSDSVKLRRQRGEGLNPQQDIGRQIVGGVSLLDRRADVRLILDSLDGIENAINAQLARDQKTGTSEVKIDRQRIAMAGHSAGAMTTQTLAGVKFYGALGRGISVPEPRIKAFIVISGQGLGRPAFRKDSWSEIHAPMLVIAGSRDFSRVSDETPEGRRHPFEYASPPDKYLVFIEGATHGSYAGKATSRLLGETPPKNVDYITDITAFSTLAFLDAHLREDPAARKYLSSAAITHYPGGKAEFQRKPPITTTAPASR